MGYQHIPNLYKEQAILAQPECYALEKIHGTSAHIKFNRIQDEVTVHFFSGGEKHENFIKLFNAEELSSRIHECIFGELVIWGEAYGGKCQGMSDTYGPALKFVAFEVSVDGAFLDIPEAHCIVKDLGLEFVAYNRIKTTLTEIDAQRDAPSVQAQRNGILEPKIREGVVLFPLVQQNDHRGNRLFAKHKRDEFRETKTPRVVTEKSIEIINAEKAANEFVTVMRLEHVLDKLPGHDITQMGTIIIPAMQEDILREGAGEVVDCPQLRREIARRTAIMYKERMKFLLTDCCDKQPVTVV
jgi:hypothetical protein